MEPHNKILRTNLSISYLPASTSHARRVLLLFVKTLFVDLQVTGCAFHDLRLDLQVRRFDRSTQQSLMPFLLVSPQIFFPLSLCP